MTDDTSTFAAPQPQAKTYAPPLHADASPPKPPRSRDFIHVRRLELEDAGDVWSTEDITRHTHELIDDVTRLIDAMSIVEHYVNHPDGHAMFLESVTREAYVSLAAALERSAVDLIANALQIRSREAGRVVDGEFARSPDARVR